MGFGNLGVALGAATQEWNNQRKMDREDEILAMQKAAEARQAEQFGWQRDDQARKAKVQQARDEANAWAAGIQKLADSKDYAGAAQQLSDFHNATGYLGNSKSQLVQGMDGNHYVIGYDPSGPEGTTAQVSRVTPELITQHLQGALAHRMMAADPDNYLANYGHIRQIQQGDEKLLQGRQGLRIEEGKASEQSRHQQRIEGITEQHYKDWYKAQMAKMHQESAQMAKLGMLVQRQEAQDKLAQELAGYEEGMRLAKGAGKPGLDAFNTYNQLAVGARIRGAGLGMKFPTEDQLNGKAVSEINPKVVEEYAKTYFALQNPTERDAFRLANPGVHAAAFGGSGELKVGPRGAGAVDGASPPASKPVVAPSAQKQLSGFRDDNAVALTSNDPLVRLEALQKQQALIEARNKQLGLPTQRTTRPDWQYVPKIGNEYP